MAVDAPRVRIALSLLALLVAAAPCEARKIRIDDDPSKGAADAPLVLAEFGDLQCPACLQYARETLPALVDAYVTPGKVRLVYLDLPLAMHPNAFAAAVAAQCAGRQGKFWEYHDQIFANLRYGRDHFTSYADALGLDRAAFDACLDDDAVEEAIREDVKQAGALGVRGTPGFVLARWKEGGEKLEVLEVIRGAQPFAVFQEKIDPHLGE